MVTHSGPALHMGFAGARFRVRPARTGTYPDWRTPINVQVFDIPGSNSVVEQDMGSGLSTITFRLWFPDMGEYRAFAAKLRTVGTLTLLAGYTRAVGTGHFHRDGHDYEDIPNVRLADIGDVVIPVDHVNIECDATFTTALNPATGATA